MFIQRTDTCLSINLAAEQVSINAMQIKRVLTKLSGYFLEKKHYNSNRCESAMSDQSSMNIFTNEEKIYYKTKTVRQPRVIKS